MSEPCKHCGYDGAVIFRRNKEIADLEHELVAMTAERDDATLAALRMVRGEVDHQRDVIAGLVLGLNGKAGQMRADGAFAALETTVAIIDAMIAKEEAAK
ncbi:MAG: hypothetical protein WC829_02680 [Hyphomicrobium sp.]|jgi:hypothetical protein